MPTGTRLPHAEAAQVSRGKIVDYLLSASHPDGRYKARFFAAFGFTAERWGELAEALRNHAIEHGTARQDDTPFGTWYTVEGELATPHGTRPTVRSVWMMDRGSTVPRLVTAYPLPQRRR
jgi:Domain of unknown function (DUF6883)